MLKMTSLDETISQYYDEQMNSSELLSYEARMALSDCVRNYTNERCFEYFKITSSMSRVNKKLRNASLLEYRLYLKNKIQQRKNKLTFKKLIKKLFKKNCNFS